MISTGKTQIPGRMHDLGGGLQVNRLLPATRCATIGPFVFFDHFGPVVVEPGMNIDVRPHPHIGLATVTYLFEGAMIHRDSLGSVQRIEPGAINWMTAGRGIVHSERTPEDLRDVRYVAHGLQVWVGLPTHCETQLPSFSHTATVQIPEIAHQAGAVRILVGQAFGEISPVKAASETLLLVLRLNANQDFELPRLTSELAVYPVSESLLIDDELVPAKVMVVLDDKPYVRLRSKIPCRVVVFGGAALDGPRYLRWNFVSSDNARIEQAAASWEAQLYAPVPGDTSYIPLPKRF